MGECAGIDQVFFLFFNLGVRTVIQPDRLHLLVFLFFSLERFLYNFFLREDIKQVIIHLFRVSFF